MITSGFLRKFWNRALRRRVLYTALDREDRGYLYLTIRTVDRVRSVAVGRIIVKILARLKEALKSPFVRRMEEYGFQKAGKLAGQAVGWGYAKARGWAYDSTFARYVTMLDVNAPSGWGN